MLSITTQDSLLQFIKSNILNGSNLSIRGLANLCGVEHTSIIRSGAFNSQKLSEKLTAQGFEAAALTEQGFNAKATWLVIEYYAYESRTPKKEAVQIARTFGTLGIMATFEQINKQPEPQIQALPIYSAVRYLETAEKIENLNNATLRELLRDQLVDELSVLRGKALNQAKPKEYTIGKVRARELGYTTQEIGNGSNLGKFLARQLTPAFVERVGKYDVRHYEVNDQLDTAIKNYFGLKKAIA